MNAFWETVDAAGFVGPLLGVCAILMWYGLGCRLWSLRGGASSAFPTVQGEARHALLTAGANGATRGQLQALLSPYLEALSAHQSTIRAVVAIAPLAGLLGTVTGMIETFDSLGSMSLFTRGGGIGAGIGEAMVSTQLGLVVAVPGLLIGALLDQKQTRIEDELYAVIEREGRVGGTP